MSQSGKNVSVSDIFQKEDSRMNSGTFINNQWVTRSFNTIIGNAPVRLNDNNIFTLQPGTYLIRARLPAFSVGKHQARLFNVTTKQVVKYGSSEIAPLGFQTSSEIIYFTGKMNKVNRFKVEHQVELLQISNGLGVASNFSQSEQIYGEVEVLKLD